MKRHFRHIGSAVCIAFFTTVLFSSCGGGGGGGMSADAGPATLYPRFAYVANAGDNSVSTYVVDAANGRLRYIGKAAAGTNPVSVTIDPSGKYAYVANGDSHNISQYTISADGALIPMATPEVAAGTYPVSIIAIGGYQ
jgi:DNA-binding beta-propeller fold protein YncE